MVNLADKPLNMQTDNLAGLSLNEKGRAWKRFAGASMLSGFGAIGHHHDVMETIHIRMVGNQP
jgi:hypothetical protein